LTLFYQKLKSLLHFSGQLSIEHWVFNIVVDAPTNVQISPNRTIFRTGDRIQCSADGNPEPTYQWKDLISGKVTEGAVLVISEEMANDNYTFQCTATNQYSNVSSVFNFTVEPGGSLLTLKLLLILCTNSFIANKFWSFCMLIHAPLVFSSTH